MILERGRCGCAGSVSEVGATHPRGLAYLGGDRDAAQVEVLLARPLDVVHDVLAGSPKD